jgi:hypothetical protein
MIGMDSYPSVELVDKVKQAKEINTLAASANVETK